MTKSIERILTESRNDLLEPIFDEILEKRKEDMFTHFDLDRLLYEYQILVEQKMKEVEENDKT
ncbi:hypothetical protein MHB40_20575 [Lysinibacillus sp. FSL K6-0057]|uniref:hypothetical protein n=1 Tax=Lysinibacillus sp. FSL K6-0057 TaxID=2921411 RepID=UPI00315A9693